MGVCVRSCVCPACPHASLGGRLWRGGVRVLLLVGCAPPRPLWFFFFFLSGGLRGVGRWLSWSGVSLSLFPHPFSSRPHCLLFVFFFPARCVSACFGCPFSQWAAALGLVLPVLACWSPGAPLGGLVVGAVWVGGLASSCGVGGRRGGCGSFSRPLPPDFFFLGGGSACSSLCLPWAGARTGRHSVWPSSLLLVVAFCQVVPQLHGSGGLCTRWARHPFLPG